MRGPKAFQACLSCPGGSRRLFPGARVQNASAPADLASLRCAGWVRKRSRSAQRLCARSSFSSNLKVEVSVSISTTPRGGSIERVEIENLAILNMSVIWILCSTLSFLIVYPERFPVFRHLVQPDQGFPHFDAHDPFFRARWCAAGQIKDEPVGAVSKQRFSRLTRDERLRIKKPDNSRADHLHLMSPICQRIVNVPLVVTRWAAPSSFSP